MKPDQTVVEKPAPCPICTTPITAYFPNVLIRNMATMISTPQKDQFLPIQFVSYFQLFL